MIEQREKTDSQKLVWRSEVNFQHFVLPCIVFLTGGGASVSYFVISYTIRVDKAAQFSSSGWRATQPDTKQVRTNVPETYNLSCLTF